MAIHILLSVVSGIVLQALVNIPLFYYLPLALVAAVLSLWKRRFLYVVVIVLSAVNLQLQRPAEPGYTERNLTYSGIVVGEDHYEHFTKLLIHIDKVFLPNDTVEHVLPVEYYAYEHGVFLGKRLVIRGRVRRARNAHRPNILTGRIVAWSIPQHFFGVVFYPVRNHIDALLRKMLSGDQYPIASGLTLGGSGRLGRELREVFSRAGILHILAVSGLHVGFVALFFGLLLFIVPLDYRLKFVIVMLGLSMYAGITGFRPSVCRAASMAFLFGMALVLQRNVSHIHVLNITALAFLIASPSLIFDIGTQLSFTAVYGILYLYPKIDALMIRKIPSRRMRFVLAPMAVSFSAQLFVAPLLVYYFHRLPMYAVLANLLIVPIAAAIIILLFLCFVTGLFWYALVEVVSFPVSVLITVLVAISEFVAKIPLSTVQITVSPLLVFPLYLLVWKRMRRFVPWAMIAAVSIFTIAGSADCLTVCIGAKSILITVPSGERILMCAQRAAAQRILLDRNGVHELDYLVAPSRYYPVKKEYITLPRRMYYKNFVYRDLTVHLSTNVLLKFHDAKLEYSLTDVQQSGENGTVTYWLSNGKRQCVLHGSLYCSIFDQLVLDARIVFARLRMLL
ncbi:MAG: ComEC/Rec2 family competence protein [bacterium]